MASSYENFVDGLHLLDIRGDVHDEALSFITFGDRLELADDHSSQHRGMPTINFADGLTLSDVPVLRSNQRHEIDFSDSLGLLDFADDWLGGHYDRIFQERLLLSDHWHQHVTRRYNYSFHDRFVIEDALLGEFFINPDDVLGLSDEMQMCRVHWHYLTFEDNLLLADAIVSKYALLVVGGVGSGYYQHGERVPISATLVGDEKFLVWAGETRSVENVHAESTFVRMPNETVWIEAIKGEVSARDIQALGGRVSAAKLEIIMEQGSSFERNLYYRDSNGNPIDMTGWTAAMHVRRQKEASTALLTLTSSAGYITIEGASGHLEVHIPANEMDDLNFIWGFYDLELYPEGDTTQAFRLLEGRIRLTKEVTV